MKQSYVADSLYMSSSNFSNIESGKQSCTEEVYIALKCIYSVEDLPLRQIERPAYQSLLDVLYNLISERKLDAAEKIYERLSVIRLRPVDKEFNISFSLHECRLFLNTKKHNEAKVILDAISIDLTVLNSDQLYHYYFNQGIYNYKTGLTNEALTSFNQANMLSKNSHNQKISLFCNIAECNRILGYISKSITSQLKANDLYLSERQSVSEFYLYNDLGIDYINIKNFQGARAELIKAYSIAKKEYASNKNENTKRNIGIVLTNFGYFYRASNVRKRAIEVIDNSFNYLNKDDVVYFESLFQKSSCMIEMGNTLFCRDPINEGIKLSKNNEYYSLCFEALSIMVRPTETSIEHFSQNILPYFIKNNHVIAVVEFATFLRKYYKENEKGNMKRAWEMAEAICDAQSKIYEGGEIEWEKDLLDLY